MARKKGTSRCSISVKGVTYDRIKAYVEEHGESISNFCELVIEEKLGPPTAADSKKFDEAKQKRIKEQKAIEDDDMKGYIPPIQFF
jgi:hypothetical protein